MVETVNSIKNEKFIQDLAKETNITSSIPTTTTSNQINDHYNPSVRLLQISKTKSGSCGFHLSRSKWDPYPWVSAVDAATPAEQNGLKAGDCVLEVNGEDILGLRITEVANLVKTKPDNVNLLLWTAGKDVSCDTESICCGPMPLNLERLSACMQTILASLECPVCMNTIPPPVMQCQNGHLLCAKCKSRSEKCPVCRERYITGRSLIAEQIYNSVIDAFNLKENCDNKLREKLFGAKCKKILSSSLLLSSVTLPVVSSSLSSSSSSSKQHLLDVNKIYQTPKNKFLAKILGKASSLDNLSNKKDIQYLKQENISNLKSLSTNDITKKGDDDEVVIPVDISSSSINRLNTNDNSVLRELTFQKRPSSLHTSTECFGRTSSSEISLSIPVPKRIDGNIYLCPLNCEEKLSATSLQQHIRVHHNTPIVLFGSSNIEIVLPPKAPIENAFLILVLDYKEFWLKLRVNDDGSIFTSALLQGFEEDENFQYMIEVRLKNCTENRLLERELITRSIVYSLMKISWNEILDKRLGIYYSYETLNTTFPNESNLILRIDIKHRNEQ